MLRTLPGAQVVFLCCVLGALVCLPRVGGLVSQLGTASGGAIGWLVYLGIGPTAVGFSTWAYALHRTDAGNLAVTTYLVPPLSILLGWAWLGETPAALAYPGGVLCLLGVAIARRRSASSADRRAVAAAGTG